MNFRSAIMLLGLVAALVACSDEKKSPDKLTETENIAVKTYVFKQSDNLLEILGTGTVSTQNEATYGFKIGGVIDRIFVNEGESFNKGTLLASLMMEEIGAGLGEAQLGLDKARRDLRRAENLYRDSVATLEQFQNAKTAYEIAEKQLQAVAFNNAYAHIYATRNGFVARKMANEGEIVESGSPIFMVHENQADSWLLNIGLSDKDWAQVEIGNAANIVLDAFPQTNFKGEVFRKSRAADVSNGSYKVGVKVEFNQMVPAIGMFGSAVIYTNRSQEFIWVPYSAIVEADGNGAFVFVPIGNGKVRKVAIEINGFDTNGVRVVSGLENVKEVVLTNSPFLNESSTIAIIQ